MEFKNDYVDLSEIPQINGKNDWKKSIGKQIKGCFKGHNYCFNISEYDKDKQKIAVEYNGKIYAIKTQYVIENSMGCVICPRNRVKDAEYLYNIGDVVGNMKVIDRRVEDRLTNTKDRGMRTIKNKTYRRVCLMCGYDNDYKNNWTTESEMKRNRGCPVCCGQKVVEGINDIPTTAPWMIPYFQGGYDEAKQYTCTSGKKIRPICPECRRIKDIKLPIFDIHRRNSIGCICGDGYSYPEKFIYSMLSQLKIEFIYQVNKKQLRWCNTYKYDFYIPKFNLIIETHGKQHYDKDFFRSYQVQKQIDEEKKNLALSNNVLHYVELDCRYSELEYVERSIRNSVLSKLFDIDLVDFKKCQEFASTNIAKKVCDMKNEHHDYTTFQLSDEFNISVGTIRRYLINGNTLGWCKYDAKEERIKACEKSVKTQKENQRAIVVKDENQRILGVFINAHRLSEVSEKVFGVKLLPSNISESCRHDANKSIYKGMTFDYVEDYILS